MIRFTCPECNATLKAADERAGSRFKCGKCGETVKVPAAAASVALAPASAEKSQLGLAAHPTPEQTVPRSVPIVWFAVAVGAAGLLGMCAGGGLMAVALLMRGLPAASTPPTSSPQPAPVASAPAVSAPAAKQQPIPAKPEPASMKPAMTVEIARDKRNFMGKATDEVQALYGRPSDLTPFHPTIESNHPPFTPIQIGNPLE